LLAWYDATPRVDVLAVLLGETERELMIRIVRKAAGVAGQTAARGRRWRKTMNAGQTILVVEDEPLVRDVVCQVLRQDGFEVLEAATGAQAETFHHDDPPPESPVLPAHQSARTAEVIDAGRPDGAGDGTWDRLPVGSRVVISNPDSIVTVDVEGVRR
jgi:CheY-like chemotaxis protein